MAVQEIKISVGEKVGNGYKAYWNCHSRYRVLKGGKASKKSTTTAMWYICHMMKYPESNVLVVRNIFKTHHDSTFAQLKWAIRRLGVWHLWQAVENPLEIRYLPTGQRILFRGFDDVEKLASTTVDKGYLCWVWLEEAFELPSYDAFEKMDLSFPRGAVPAPLFKQTTVTFNPWSEKHWLKKRFFDEEHANVSTFTTNYLCNEFLGEDDRQIYEEMKILHPRKYAVAGLGEWGISEGLIYENWETSNFDIGDIQEKWKYSYLFGLDYGYTNDPTAFIAIAVNPIDKIMYIYDEHYEKRMLNSDIANMIIRKGYAKERIRADSAEPKSNEDIRRKGVHRIFPASKGKDSINNGISKIQEYKMIVHTSCTNTITELSSYIWDKGKDDTGINRPVDRDNHLMDALRYAMEDIKYAHPEKDQRAKDNRRLAKHNSLYSGTGGVTPSDLRGGWNG